MIDEIKADEIIRTTDGKLYRIVSASKEDFLCLEMKKDATRLELLSDLNLAKHRKKLIDLIEEHDIIEFEYNGAVYKEEVIRYDDGDTYYYELSFSPEDGIGYNISIFDEDIKILSILTHEEFEMRKYKVKEN